MDFKTNVSLSSEQLADLFEIFAMTIRQSNNIKIPLGNSEMTIDVGEHIGLGIEFSQEKSTSSLNLSVQWTTEAKPTEKEPLSIPKAEAPQIHPPSPPEAEPPKPSTQPETPPVAQSTPPQSPPVSTPVSTTAAKLTDRALPYRIELATNTIGTNGGGKFVSAFSTPATSKWQMVVGPQETADLKEDEEEDLFASLESKIKPDKRKKKSTPEPLGLIPTAKTPEVDLDEKEVLQWKEPSPEENVTDDDWKKPSELLKQTKTPPSEIPSPTVPSPKPSATSPKPVANVPPAQMKKPNYDLPPPPSIPAAKRPEGAPVPPDVKKKEEKKNDKKIGWSEWD